LTISRLGHYRLSDDKEQTIMADITRYPFLHHVRADTTAYVQHLRNGRVKHAGPGLAFWFRPATSALSEVPLDDREQALLFHARSADFQDLTVQATVNYRVVDPAVAATRIDFGISPKTGQWNATPLETLGGLLTELAQQPALDQLAGMAMAEALARGIAPVRDRVAATLAHDDRLAERGLAVTDVRVVAIRTDAEVERALQTQTREQVQQEADRATYERRAMAVERERAIAENELHNQIELARREAELVTQRGQNDRKRAEEKAAADRIRTAASAEQRRLIADATADTTRLVGRAEADAEGAKLEAYRQVENAVLLGLAIKELAANLPNITNLTITPDLLAPVLARLAQPGPSPSGSPQPGSGQALSPTDEPAGEVAA
jgi:regulator of protease activity HflC (stomatin/prohibitin superfamily)